MLQPPSEHASAILFVFVIVAQVSPAVVLLVFNLLLCLLSGGAFALMLRLPLQSAASPMAHRCSASMATEGDTKTFMLPPPPIERVMHETSKRPSCARALFLRPFVPITKREPRADHNESFMHETFKWLSCALGFAAFNGLSVFIERESEERTQIKVSARHYQTGFWCARLLSFQALLGLFTQRERRAHHNKSFVRETFNRPSCARGLLLLEAFRTFNLERAKSGPHR